MIDSLNPDIMRDNIRKAKAEMSANTEAVDELNTLIGATPLETGKTVTSELADHESRIDELESGGTAEDISSSITITAPETISTITKTAYKTGNVVFLDLGMTTSSNITVGSNIDFELSGIIPKMLVGVMFESTHTLIAKLNEGKIRVRNSGQINSGNTYNISMVILL